MNAPEPNLTPGASPSPLVQKLNEADSLRNNGDPVGALAILDRVVQAHPSNARALNDMGICLRLIGDPVKAAMVLRKARKLAPDSAQIVANLANCLRDQGDMNTAIKAYQKALQLQPNFALVHAELGAVYQAVGKPDQAVQCYEKALKLNPDHGQTLANLSSASLEIGDPQRALDMANRSLLLAPKGRRALAVKSIALHELGQIEEASELVDLAWVRPFPFQAVEGYASVDSFNEALSEHVTRHPSLEYEPSNRSTKKGEQTGELLNEPKGPVAQLEKMIEESVEKFLDDLPKDRAHPYLTHRPKGFRLNIWGTRLGAQGHQYEHIHPGGWVSGVYYAQLPPDMSSSSEQHAGWIQFGGAPKGSKLERERPLRLIEPKQGTLVLFPSYYYHRTLPFESETKRISIAFDAIPED
ncbi:MAG: hypothetical protein ACI8X5_000408 [Planctomycetota bacterium]|jgi:uncharacterized protein (TIGR02466 family)